MTADSGNNSEFIRKKVDESWKDSVQKEKETGPQKTGDTLPPQADFLAFVSTLAIQTAAALGQTQDPSGGKAEVDLVQAQYFIDILQMLSEKTRGNLSETEASEMENMLYQLRLAFVQKKQEAGI